MSGLVTNIRFGAISVQVAPAERINFVKQIICLIVRQFRKKSPGNTAENFFALF